MVSVSIHSLGDISSSLTQRLYEAQVEAARLWNDITAYHFLCRSVSEPWPSEAELRDETKGGRYALYSQTVQAIVARFCARVDAARTRRSREPGARRWLRFPYRDKRFQPLAWPAQAVSYDASAKRLLLPMGRGNRALIFRLDLDFAPGAVTLVWDEGYALHIVRPVATAIEPPGSNTACVDLGEIHLAAVATDTGEALVVSGRGIRADKRLLSKQLGSLAKKRSRCTKGSRQHRRLQLVRQKRSRLAKRRIRDKRHKATRAVIDFCVRKGVGRLFVGDPRGVRDRRRGRHHNQRMARWEMGKDLSYLGHKAERAAIMCSTGDERGTSSRCPCCGHRHKPHGRLWACRRCGFAGPRDVVGAVNMHPLAFSQTVTFPALVTYRRPGPDRGRRGMNNRAADLSLERRSRLDTGQGVSPVAHSRIHRQAPGLPGRRKSLPTMCS